MTYVDSKVYLIGGSASGEDSTRDYALDLDSFEWSIIERKGKDAPASIDEHSANLFEDKIIIFGGNISGSKSNLMFLFDIKLKSWKKLWFTDGPWARSWHSAVIYSNCLYIFGGKDQDWNKLDDFWKFDINKQTWIEIQKLNETPLKRSGHSAIIYKNFMIIFGGIYELTQELNDMHAYDFNNNQWITLHIETENLSPHGGETIDRKTFIKSNTSASLPKAPESKLSSAIKDNIDSKTKFGLSMKITDKSKRTRQSNLTKVSGRMSITKLEKLINKKRVDQEHKKEDILLTSPTSLSMKNSFLIKTVGKSFDNYYHLYKKKKTITSKIEDDMKHVMEKNKGKIEGKVPKPRDGHTWIIHDNRYMIVFGGDRHHVPFNDIFSLDLAKEI